MQLALSYTNDTILAKQEPKCFKGIMANFTKL